MSDEAADMEGLICTVLASRFPDARPQSLLLTMAVLSARATHSFEMLADPKTAKMAKKAFLAEYDEILEDLRTETKTKAEKAAK